MTKQSCIAGLSKLIYSGILSQEAIDTLNTAIGFIRESDLDNSSRKQYASCKKCGAVDTMRTLRYSENNWRCVCLMCGYATKRKNSKADAIFAWNQQPYKKLIKEIGMKEKE